MRIFPSRRKLHIYATLVLLFVFVKFFWLMAFRIDGARLLDGKERKDLLHRRAWLVDQWRRGALGIQGTPSFLPSQFKGEWALGAYSMLTAALANISFLHPETREESVRIIAALIEEALDPSMREFDTRRWGEDPLQTLSGASGHLGYLGHLNWMLGAHRFLGGDNRFDPLHQQLTSALANRLKRSPAFCAETYPGEIYIPDNVVVLASIRNYDRLFGTSYGKVVDDWITVARSRLLDRGTGLLVFSLQADGSPWEGSRGSGAGWNSFYLPFVDRPFAAEQYGQLKRHFVRRLPVAITGIREYPAGVWRTGDVDSGPVIFGLSSSGTAFAMGGARHARDVQLLNDLLWTAELIGSTVEWQGRRRYLLPPLVGEAIILAMKTATLWDTRYAEELRRKGG